MSLEHINPIAPSGHFPYDRGSFIEVRLKNQGERIKSGFINPKEKARLY